MPNSETEIVVLDAPSALGLRSPVRRERAAAVGLVLAATASPQVE
jgi:hypothetical protein